MHAIHLNKDTTEREENFNITAFDRRVTFRLRSMMDINSSVVNIQQTLFCLDGRKTTHRNINSQKKTLHVGIN